MIILQSPYPLPPFSPAELFGSGEKGFWYDPSDLSTVFSDLAGTVPAVVDGPVGKILDKSGNGVHATAPTTARRPTLRQSGAEYYLEFDGVDDTLVTSSVNLTGTPAMSTVMRYGLRNTPGSNGIIMETATLAATSNPGGSFLNVTASSNAVTAGIAGPSAVRIATTGVLTVPSVMVTTREIDVSVTGQNELKLRINGADNISTRTDVETGAALLSTQTYNFGSRTTSGSRVCKLDLYGVVHLGRAFVDTVERDLCESFFFNIEEPAGPFTVIVMVGQSNNERGSTIDTTTDIAGPNVYQWGQIGANDGRIVGANEPIEHIDRSGDKIGYGVPFARDHFIPANPGAKVLLVPCAKGGTGFSNANWNPGNALYETAITRTNAAMDTHPDNQLVIFFHGGETDALAGWSEVQFAAAFDAMIADFRSRVTGGASAPLIVGGMVPAWVAAAGSRQPVQDAILHTPNRVANSAYADPSVPTVLLGTAGDEIHYTAASQRLLGGRYWTAYASL